MGTFAAAVGLLSLAALAVASCTSSGGDGSGGNAPCEPLPDAYCSPLSNVHACDGAGPAKPSEDCSIAACVAGAVCVNHGTYDHDIRMCEALCTSDADCAAGAICLPLKSECGPPALQTCTQPCNLATSEGCPTPGTFCVRGYHASSARYFTRCERPPPQGVKESSFCAPGGGETAEIPCLPGLLCADNEAYYTSKQSCHRICTTDGAAPCPDGGLCIPTYPVGDTPYGVCQCDSAGHCTTVCGSAADCPPPNQDCVEPTCTSTQCGLATLPDGTPCSNGGTVCKSGHCVQP
ncbi:MAG: hypothetical protein U0414_39115 [Polyangiaceae bacterium]